MNPHFDKAALTDAVLELIRLTSTKLPADVIAAMEKGIANEEEGSPAKSVLSFMLRNALEAEAKSTPICQDTGTNLYFVTLPVGVSMKMVEEAIIDATKIATENTYLRPNTVDPVTGENPGDNTGTMVPFIHFEEGDAQEIRIDLALKGGGSENVSDQYKLPNSRLKAGRNLTGVYKCIIDAVHKAQGLGCAPGVLGIGIGGDRASGMIQAKKQLFRKLTDTNPNRELADLEEKLYKDLNTLGIGPMGFGGNTTVMGVKIGTVHRLPASFFVSIAYMCWADRRHSMIMDEEGVRYD